MGKRTLKSTIKMRADKFLFGIIFLLSCCPTTKNAKPNNRNILFDHVSQVPLKDTTINYDSSLYYNVKQLNTLLSQPDLAQNKGDIGFKIYYWNQDTNYILTLSADKLKTSLDIIGFKYFHVSTHSYLELYDRIKQEPLLCNSICIRQILDSFKLLNISPQEPEFRFKLSGGIVYFIEVTTKGSYQNYEYFEPNFFRFVSSPSGKLDGFLRFINFKLGLNLYKIYNDSFFEKSE